MASAASPTQYPRLDKIPAGSFVRLGLQARTELAIFLGVTGTGEDRRARFVQPEIDGARVFEWEAYRFRGSWTYGSGADRLSLLEVIT